MSEPLRAMMIGAHPDDVDICTCGITKRLVSKGCIVRFVSMTTGNAGHQTMRGEELIKTRAAEAQKSAAYLGATYEILPFDDGRLTPSLEARETLMRTIRNFKPDVIFTNRACDYHPDHRATGQLVQDCSYLMGVPAICPDTPVLRKTPTILYWADGFTDPNRSAPISPARQMTTAKRCFTSSAATPPSFSIGFRGQMTTWISPVKRTRSA